MLLFALQQYTIQKNLQMCKIIADFLQFLGTRDHLVGYARWQPLTDSIFVAETAI